MTPFDYTLQQPPALGSVLGGFEAGFALSERERQRQAQEAQMRAQQEAQMRAAQIQERFYNNQNPSLQDVIEFTTTLDPALVGHTKDMLAKLPEQQKQRNLSTGLQMLSALDTGSTDVVTQIAEESATALENSGDANTAQLLRRVAEVAKQDPNIARSGIMASLIQYPGGDKAIESYIAARKAPAETAKIEAEARESGSKALSAAVAAKFAESKAVQDLRLGEAQIKKLAEDTEIARMNARIAAMNAATSREGNDLKRQELQLKINDMQRERDSKLREKVATVEAGRASMDNMLNTIDRVLKNPALNDVLGSLEGRMPAAASAFDDQESDAIALIDTLGSQAFLAQIPNIKGMGALSNAEGEKLQSALQNLSRAQSEKQFRASLKEAQRLVLKGRKNLSAQYGVPDTVPDTPAAEPSASEVDALINRYAR